MNLSAEAWKERYRTYKKLRAEYDNARESFEHVRDSIVRDLGLASSGSQKVEEAICIAVGRAMLEEGMDKK